MENSKKFNFSMTDGEKKEFKEDYLKLTSMYLDCMINGDVKGMMRLMNSMVNIIPAKLMQEIQKITEDDEELFEEMENGIADYVNSIEDKIVDIE